MVLDVIVGYVRGLKGDTGETGATGATGEAATISVGTVSTAAYGQQAQVTNVGTSEAAVFDFVIPEGRPGEVLADMSNLTNNTITTSTSEFPVPAVGDTGATLWGKVVKFFSDIRSAVNAKIDSSKITTSLAVTTAGSVADATVSKVLNDKITAINDSVSSLGTYVMFTPTFASSITDIFARTARGFYNPMTKMCFLTIYIISNGGLIPVANNTICTIPSAYAPIEDIQFPALLVPKSSVGWSDVQTEAGVLTTQGAIRLGNFVYGATATKLFAINVTYFCR